MNYYYYYYYRLISCSWLVYISINLLYLWLFNLYYISDSANHVFTVQSSVFAFALSPFVSRLKLTDRWTEFFKMSNTIKNYFSVAQPRKLEVVDDNDDTHVELRNVRIEMYNIINVGIVLNKIMLYKSALYRNWKSMITRSS